jgi:hypothetical protein
MEKKGATFVAENLIFIILNLIFLVIIILFISGQSGGIGTTEQNYAKQIALLIDSSKPEMMFKLNLEKAKEISEENGIDFSNIIKINGNLVFVQLSDKSGEQYSFFKDVDVNYYPEAGSSNYVFIIREKDNE